MFLEHIVQSFASGFQTGIATAKEFSHVGGNQSVGEPIEGAFVLNFTQIQSAGGIQINDPSVGSKGTYAGSPHAIFKSDELHAGCCRTQH